MKPSDISVEFSYDGTEYLVEGKYSPATPDVHYLRNGDPGQPGDPAEFEVHYIAADDKVLSNDEIDKLCENEKWLDAAYEAAGDSMASRAEDAAEARADEIREERDERRSGL
jgi:hypothetical protein